nr:MAG TPA: hypothetical protein [Caudoviricetes sp.]
MSRRGRRETNLQILWQGIRRRPWLHCLPGVCGAGKEIRGENSCMPGMRERVPRGAESSVLSGLQSRAAEGV